MKGMLIKDLLCAKRYGKAFGMTILFYGVYSIMFGNLMMVFSMIMALCSLIVTISAFSYDDASKWNGYATALPVKRSDLVIARYVFVLITTAIGMVISILVVLATALITRAAPDFGEVLPSALGSLAGVTLMLAVMCPLTYKLGVDKARLILVSIALVPSVLILLADKINMQLPEVNESTLMMLFTFAPIIALALLMLSCAVSIGIVNRKDKI